MPIIMFYGAPGSGVEGVSSNFCDTTVLLGGIIKEVPICNVDSDTVYRKFSNLVKEFDNCEDITRKASLHLDLLNIIELNSGCEEVSFITNLHKAKKEAYNYIRNPLFDNIMTFHLGRQVLVDFTSGSENLVYCNSEIVQRMKNISCLDGDNYRRYHCNGLIVYRSIPYGFSSLILCGENVCSLFCNEPCKQPIYKAGYAKIDLSPLLQQTVGVVVTTDFDTLFSVLSKSSSVNKDRLQRLIDIYSPDSAFVKSLKEMHNGNLFFVNNTNGVTETQRLHNIIDIIEAINTDEKKDELLDLCNLDMSDPYFSWNYLRDSFMEIKYYCLRMKIKSQSYLSAILECASFLVNDYCTFILVLFGPVFYFSFYIRNIVFMSHRSRNRISIMKKISICFKFCVEDICVCITYLYNYLKSCVYRHNIYICDFYIFTKAGLIYFYNYKGGFYVLCRMIKDKIKEA